MKIVDRKTFLAMPAGVLFCKFKPYIFGEVSIKTGTVGNDFVVQDIAGWFEGAHDTFSYIDGIDAMIEKGVSYPMDYDCDSRDGLFDEDQLFAVWERTDMERLIARLQKALVDGYGG
ncbi:hypothetical protein [Mesorhizobium sp.]|uniref:hypothetical protein n=1 Tax=Mesorhizobium sp. TaxID=1871066 RepID=UPI000FEA018A|nr:hypothetical protein [Mesorhizobium sp.]RWF33754.1 MAG: hypothetical protein EOS45_02150 [Mesorhizobium sp.]